MLEDHVIERAQDLLQACVIQDWVDNPHLKDTPRRFAQMLTDLTTPVDYNFTTFPNEGLDEMVIIKGIPFYTLCAHHVIPFFGEAHVAYVPGPKIAGLSKFARAVQYFAKGLNVQEELTQTVADFLDDELAPRGVAVIMEAEHLCMTMRGAQVPGTRTRTGSMKGVFADHSRTAKAEFLAAIGN